MVCKLSMMYEEQKIALKRFVNPEKSVQWRSLTLKKKKMTPLSDKEFKSYATQ